MSADRNAPPKSGWARMVTELHVDDLNASLAFWKGLIGFETAYRREEEKFVYLEHPEGQQIMLCQRQGRFETGPLQHPLGQGAMFQIYLRDISSILANLAAQNWPIYLGPREVWRKTGDRESGQREVFVQDPDGYLLMLAQSIGERILPGADEHQERSAAEHNLSPEAERRGMLGESLAKEPRQSFRELAARVRALTKGRRQTPAEVLFREGRDER
jgi:catechol 2,3-dioxygenase-like lactoylglutathione lyase family enzyme/plasmid stability protein